MTQPPKLPLRILDAVLPPHARDEVLGDLHEEWQEVATARGRWLAGAWCAVHALILSVWFAARFPWLHGILGDFRAVLRGWRRQPVTAAVIVVTFALAIGANAAVLSVVKAVLLNSFGIADADRFITLAESNRAQNTRFTYVSARTFVAWRDGSTSFEGMAPATWTRYSVASTGEPAEVIGARVSWNYFRLAGMQPRLGRTFLPGEDRPGAPARVVILSDGLWKRAFGADPGIIGTAVRLNGENHTVVGVMPYSFGTRYAGWGEIWTPLGFDEERAIAGGSRVLGPVARLKPGVSIEHARAELNAISARLAADFPAGHAGFGATAFSVPDYVLLDIRPALVFLSAGAAILLLVAAANIGGLLIARALAQRSTFAIRRALGASAFRMLRFGICEAIVLGIIGSALGIGLGRTLVITFASRAPDTMPRVNETVLDGQVVAISLLVAAIVTVLIGVLPTLALRRDPVEAALRSQRGRTTGGATGTAHLRSALVVCQIAACVALLVTGGLLIRSVMALLAVDPGFKSDNVLTAEVSLPAKLFPDPDAIIGFHRTLNTNLEHLPRVQAVAAVGYLPLQGGEIGRIVYLDSQPVPTPGDEVRAFVQSVTPKYFDTLRIPLLSGRTLTEREAWEDGGVAIVSQTFASRNWPGAGPAGRRLSIRPRGAEPRWLTVVGVVGDTHVRSRGLEWPADAGVYVPIRDLPNSRMNVVLRTEGPPTELMGAVRAEIRRLSPDAPITTAMSLEEFLDRSKARRTLPAMLLAAFAVVSLVLAAIGLYGLVSYAVVQRIPEFGIRLALGATPGEIIGLVVRQTMALVLVGLTAGLLLVAALSGLLSGLLFRVRVGDPIVVSIVIAVLFVTAASAVLIPATRAVRRGPIQAIRAD
jgi:putative ABC transport system permease protein